MPRDPVHELIMFFERLQKHGVLASSICEKLEVNPTQLGEICDSIFSNYQSKLYSAVQQLPPEGNSIEAMNRAVHDTIFNTILIGAYLHEIGFIPPLKNL